MVARFIGTSNCDYWNGKVSVRYSSNTNTKNLETGTISIHDLHTSLLSPQYYLIARFGVIHPPAAAAAMVFASGNKTWAHMGIFLVAVCFSIVMAVTINNMSAKRQYPTSWSTLRWISAFRTKKLKKGLTT
mmetsp:Transcript_7842/g.16272  ORF Transcript_7842/g.16272 Transcript_7842/m.16272 type:complete len:131 (+) Transcript_7842:1123-1515(+)